ARATGFVVVPEATSGLRFVEASILEGVAVLGAFDALARSPAFRRVHAPDVIVQLGATPTSSAFTPFVAANRGVEHVVVHREAAADPDATATELVLADVGALAARLARAVERRGVSAEVRAARVRWAAALRAADRIAREVLDGELAVASARGPLTEGLVTRAVFTRAPEGERVVVGNGLPIRHADTFVHPGDAVVSVLAQRGVSGIDGLVSGAAGAASVSDAGVTLLVGDVAALHDLGGLAVAATVRAVPLAIVVIHNDGGRIFEQLPVAKLDGLAPGTIEHFTTPHGRSFAGAASMFGVAHHAVRTPAELARAIDAARSTPGATLIEAHVPVHDAQETHSRLWGAIDRRLAEAISRRNER
ncbi:thiamine pyrophosphate-dependent enzyme, partial [Myxococcota bacterium]|nr:thiamine pyrophosphate-dependent enzyme [Myxococcota bacterium]